MRDPWQQQISNPELLFTMSVQRIAALAFSELVNVMTAITCTESQSRVVRNECLTPADCISKMRPIMKVQHSESADHGFRCMQCLGLSCDVSSYGTENLMAFPMRSAPPLFSILAAKLGRRSMRAADSR
ncbi:hypothetical protein DOTSEDRAFT_68920 [Dothistroma septosporum NZE10]|uniref:Uncharacterized protein n=1 Tax=Dothistroma septosporum (strain NZE10 / CBS 128990) TaxID=675120 RepID=N1Q570_DOTSN|nr:hypothetical protein DOTSEDRAFT_68920 [Dothistroma septosporum NZE10]